MATDALPADRTTVPWPFWLLRYLATDDRQAMDDLVWSVGGSPPYGGVSYEEGAAVYELLESFHGPGAADERLYAALAGMLAPGSEAALALELFRRFDAVVSAEGGFGYDQVAECLELATRLGHAGAAAYFRTLLAELAYKAGEVPAARAELAGVYPVLVRLSVADQAYLGRLMATARNLVTFTALDGEPAAARAMLGALSWGGPAPELDEHRRLLGDPPAFPGDLAALLEGASDRLEGGKPLGALEWYGEAEARARAAGDEAALCGLLGDKAVAFRRVGNLRRAIDTYAEVIELARAREDWLNLSRWSQNLGMLLLEREEPAMAEPHLKEGMVAALRSGLPRQIGSASLNLAVLLQRQDRFAEAIEAMDQARASAGRDPGLQKLWRRNTAGIYQRWGRSLMDEGQISEARDAFVAAAGRYSRDDPEEREQLALVWASLVALHERLNDMPAARAAAAEALALFEAMGKGDAAAWLRGWLAEQGPVARVRELDPSADEVAAAEAALAGALAAGDGDAEARARLALCNGLLGLGDARAFAELDAALALVRRLEDRSRELILCLNFTVPVLERGEARRAMTLANRAVELAGPDQAGRRIFARFNLGKVWAEGFGEPRRALECYGEGAAALSALAEADPGAAETTAGQLRPRLAEAARLALELGQTDAAVELVRLFDREGAEQIARTRSARAGPAAPTLAELRAATRAEFDPVLAAWRGEAAGGPGDGAADAILAEMAQLAQLVGWRDAHERLAGLRAPAAAPGASAGVAGQLALAELAARGLDLDAARELARGLAAAPDDLLCLALYAARDRELGKSGASFGLLRLCAETAPDSRLAARCCELLAIFTQGERPEEALAWNRAGAEGLRDGADEALRAKLLNEAAALLLRLSRPEEAGEAARAAREAALAAGADEVAISAAGNLGVALLHLRRYEEALAALEPLAAEQAARGDERGLAITRHNLAACYAALGRDEPGAFDPESTDPDVLANVAAGCVRRGDVAGALAAYERALGLIAAWDRPYDHEVELRMGHARALYSAGRPAEATAQMQEAARQLEARRDPARLREAYAWLTGVSVAYPETAEYYGRRALELSRGLGDAEALAVDLGQLAQTLLIARRFDEALALLDEAAGLSDLPGLALARADAMVGAGRPAEALALCRALLERAGDDAGTAVHALVTMAEAHGAQGDAGEELRLLREAYARSAPGRPSRGGVQAASRLGVPLIRAGRLEEAARVLDDGLAQLRALGGGYEEHALLNNLGLAQQSLGDLAGAEATFLRAREGSRGSGDDRSELIALAHLGNVAAAQGRHELALARYLEAADLARTLGDGEVEATCLDAAGSMLARRGQPERAIEYHRRAAGRHRELARWDDAVTDLLNLASAYLALRETEQADGALAEARALAERWSLGQALWSLRLIEGQARAQAGSWDEARAAFREAIVALEGVRQGLQTPLQQRQWAASRAHAYDIAAEEALRAGDGPAAVELIECNKGRFLQAVLLRRATRPEGLDEGVWLAYERVADRLAELRARHRAALARGDGALEPELREAEAEHARALAQLQGQEPAPPPFAFPDWRELARALPPGHAAVALAVFPGGLGVAALGRAADGGPWARARLDPRFGPADLRELLVGQAGPEGGQSWAALAPGSRQGEAILAHVCAALGARVWPAIVAALPPGVEDLVLMPGAGLNVLPLHAAPLPGGEGAGERYRVAYAPSLALLEQAVARWALPAAPALGQAVRPTEDPPLPFSRVEAADLARRSGLAAEQLVGPAATVAGVLGLLRRCAIFHFSGHGFYDARDPFRSGLHCAPVGDDQGVLTLAATLGSVSGIGARLVVLSACETGQVQPDDVTSDFLGLPGGLLVAGAGAVLATFWRIEDLATCLLLGRVFELWRDGGLPLAEALRCAQAWLRDEVTVDTVTEQIEQWLDDLPELEDELSDAHGRWLVRRDRGTRPFRSAYYWAGFYLTGLAGGGA